MENMRVEAMERRTTPGWMVGALGVAVAVMAAILLAGCGSGKMVVGQRIAQEDITEFYWTYANINFDARYQRYRFFLENGVPHFFHDTRERPNGYGWLTEEDTAAMGSRELTPEEWGQFFVLVAGGTVEKRTDSAESGDSGPWYYLYWKGDRDVYQVFTFASGESEAAFEEFGRILAKTC